MTHRAFVDSTGVSRRLRALIAIGYSQTQLAARLRIRASNLSTLIHGKRPRVSPVTYRAVCALFKELWAHPAQGPGAERSRAIAKSHGWVGPLAWDDIDDPAERPNIRGGKPDPVDKENSGKKHIDEIAVERAMRGDRVKLTRLERLDAIRRLHARKWSDRRVGLALHIDERTVLRNRQELGLAAFEFSEIRQADSA